MRRRAKLEQLRQLTAEMRSGKVDMLVVLNTNPVYDAPPDLDFLDALNKVGLRVHLGLYQDETAKYCHWHVNGTHYLEQWGDTRTFDGTVSFIQPLIAPLYGGHSESELIEFLTNENEATSYELTQRYWQAQHTGADFKSWWDRSLCTMDSWRVRRLHPKRGVLPKAALPPAAGARRADWRSSSAAIPRFTTDALRTMAGCKRLRSR